MFKRILSVGLLSVLALTVVAYPTTAQEAKKATTNSDVKDQAERSVEASEVLTEIMNIPENSIPEDLMARAHGIAVIPHVVKGAFGIGGQWGKGLMQGFDVSTPRRRKLEHAGLRRDRRRKLRLANWCTGDGPRPGIHG
jgi:hypothetical protein